jgi:hypothetical protein
MPMTFDEFMQAYENQGGPLPSAWSPEAIAEFQEKQNMIGMGKISGIKDYYPKNVIPIHEVQDWSKVRGIVRALKRGEEIPPIVTEGDQLLTGTHRSAANDLIDMLIQKKNLDPKTPKVGKMNAIYDEVPENIRNQVENGHWDSLDEYFKARNK